MALETGIIFYGTLLALAGATVAPFILRRDSTTNFVIAAFMLALTALLWANFLDVDSRIGSSAYAGIALLAATATMIGLAVLSRPAPRVWLAVGAFMLCVETGARIFPIKNTQDANPGVAHFWPDHVFRTRNNFGFLDRNFITPKAAGVYRILLLGDSFTEGAGLYRDQTFGRLMERQLSRTEVYNLGRSGYNTRQEADVLLQLGAQLDPDLVILNYVPNDAQLNPLERTYQDLPAAVIVAHRALSQRLRSYAAYSILTVIEGALPKNFPNYVEFYKSQHAPDSKGWASVKGGMSDIQKWASERSIPVVAAYWPILYDGWSADALVGQVTDEMSLHGFDVVDLTPGFVASSKTLGELGISDKDGHPNAKANEIAAGILINAVRRLMGKRSENNP
jgi:hypothetical protein